MVDGEQILAVAALCRQLRETVKLVERNVAQPQRDLFRTCDAQALPLLQDLHKMARLDERRVSAGVEPGETAAEHFDKEITPFQVTAINVRDFQFAAR